MEDSRIVMKRVMKIIERLREKSKANGRDLSHQNTNIQLTSMTLKESCDNLEKVCPICGGTGYIIKKNPKAQDTVIFCECRELDKVKRMWKSSGIETKKNKLSFSNYKAYNKITKESKEAALAYFKTFDRIKDTRRNSIAFLGQVGSGKTHLSIAIGLNLLSKKIPVVYMSYRDQILKLKQNIMDEEYYSACVNKFKTCKVLIIDDLFKGKINESDINIMFEIINYRYMNNLPIIVSSEFFSDNFLCFDEGIGSRILEMCKDYIIEIKGQENNYRIN